MAPIEQEEGWRQLENCLFGLLQVSGFQFCRRHRFIGCLVRTDENVKSYTSDSQPSEVVVTDAVDMLGIFSQSTMPANPRAKSRGVRFIAPFA